MDENKAREEHRLIIEGRQKLQVSGVLKVENFTEEEICVITGMGLLLLVGEELHINQLHLEEGRLLVSGRINSIQYKENKNPKETKQKGVQLLHRLTR